uniref:L1 transposable element RRM domain-containing protein n=1 Tax=Latimeria chalumnae TaxID=7897 RepID=H3ACQ4_LATCH
ETTIIMPSRDMQMDIKNTTRITARLLEIDTKLDTMEDRFEEVEMRISQIEDYKEDRDTKMADLEKKLGRAWDHIEDLDNCSRRNNVCIMGLPEGIEEGRPIEFLNKVLPAILEIPEGEVIEIEQAHRSFMPRPQPSQWPHPIIMCLLKYQTQELILQKAREKQNIVWEYNKIAFFQDLSKEIQLKRKAFMESKRQLRVLGVKYTMAYPATLRIQHEGIRHSFQSPESVISFIKQ